MVDTAKRTQRLTPANRQNVTSNATPNAFGAAEAQGLRKVAQGVDVLEANIAYVQDQQDKMLAEQQVNAYSDFARTAMYSPDYGYTNTRGQSAVEGRQNVEDLLEKERKRLGENLTPAQADMYNRASKSRQNMAYNTTNKHASAQAIAWENDAATARIQTFGNDALAMSADPEQFSVNMMAGLSEIDQLGTKNGWSVEQTQSVQDEFTSDVYKSAVLQRAVDAPLKAQEYYESVRDHISEKSQTALDNALKAPVLQAHATNNTNAIMSGTFGEAPSGFVTVGDIILPQGNEGDIVNSATSNNMTKTTTMAAEDGMHPPKTLARPERERASSNVFRRYANADEIVTTSSGVDVTHMHPQARDAFTRLQGMVGQLHVRSGYRSSAANKKAGGAKHSQHLHGKAFDIDLTGLTKPERNEIIAAAIAAGFNGIGVGSTGIHVDTGNMRSWGYKTSAGGAAVPAWARETVEAGFAKRRAKRTRNTRSRNARPSATGNDEIGNTNDEALDALNSDNAYRQDVMDAVASIEDPDIRAATAKEVTRRIQLQDAAQAATVKRASDAAGKWAIANPNSPPTDLTPEQQRLIGVSGMQQIWSYQDNVKSHGKIDTMPEVRYKLMRLYAEDPQAFYDVDLLQHINELSTTDFNTLTGYQVNAQQALKSGNATSGPKPKSIQTMMSIAQRQLDAAGIVTSGKSANAESRQLVANFQNALVDRSLEFEKENKRPPNEAEIYTLVDQLLTPIVTSQDGFSGWLWGDGESFLFQAPYLDDDQTFTVDIEYTDIPISERRIVAAELERKNGSKPTEDEVKSEYLSVIYSTK